MFYAWVKIVFVCGVGGDVLEAKSDLICHP